MHGVRVHVGACPHPGRARPAPHPGVVGGRRPGAAPPRRPPPPPPARSPPAVPAAAAHHLKPPRCRVRAGGSGPRRGVTAGPGWRRCPPGRGTREDAGSHHRSERSGGTRYPPPLPVPQFPLCALGMLCAKGGGQGGHHIPCHTQLREVTRPRTPSRGTPTGLTPLPRQLQGQPRPLSIDSSRSRWPLRSHGESQSPRPGGQEAVLPPGLAFPPALLPGVSFAGGTMGTGEEGTGRGGGRDGGRGSPAPLRRGSTRV